MLMMNNKHPCTGVCHALGPGNSFLSGKYLGKVCIQSERTHNRRVTK